MDDILCNLINCTFRSVLAITLKNIQPPSGILFIAVVANCSVAHKMKGLFGLAFLLCISVGKLFYIGIILKEVCSVGFLGRLSLIKGVRCSFLCTFFFLHASGKRCLGYLSKKSELNSLKPSRDINVMKRIVAYMSFRRALSINLLPRFILAFVYMCCLYRSF